MKKLSFLFCTISAVSLLAIHCAEKEFEYDNPYDADGTSYRKFTITFDANGGTVSPSQTKATENGRLAYLPTPTRDGYVFIGWFTAATGGTQVRTWGDYDATEFNANTTIYAQWTPSYTITFDANGGTVTPESAKTDAQGRVNHQPLPTLTRSCYTFNGWFTAATGGDEVRSRTVFSADTTIYAQWTQNVTVTTFVDDRDNKTYKKVTIGTQTWMAENLNYDVPNNTSDVCYNNSADSCAKYGRLYNWETAMTACPVGWHLPSNAEWDTLVTFVGGQYRAGTRLKSSIGWGNNYYGSGNGTDEFGFSALPGGGTGGTFYYTGVAGVWWSATEGDADNAYYQSMRHSNNYVDRYDNGGKADLYSIRCVEDVDVSRD